jgi:hypothetical protein
MSSPVGFISAGEGNRGGGPAATVVLHAGGHGLELLDALVEVLGGGIA